MSKNLDLMELLDLLRPMADEYGEVQGNRKDLYEPLGVEESDVVRGLKDLRLMGHLVANHGEGDTFNVTLSGYSRE